MSGGDSLEALVVGGVDYGDADRIVHLLTREGRLSVFAHSARKSRRRFAGALEPFSTIRVTFDRRRTHRTHDGMRTIVSAVVERARLSLREDLAKIALSSYVVEIASAVAPEGEASDGTYTLVTAVLDELVSHKATITLRRAFELQLVDALGYRPVLDACAVCGEEAHPTYLDFSHGGVLCARHRGCAQEIGPRTLVWIRQVVGRGPRVPGGSGDPAGTAPGGGSEVFDAQGGLPPEWAETAARKIGRAVSEFFGTLLSRPLKSLAWLEEVDLK